MATLSSLNLTTPKATVITKATVLANATNDATKLTKLNYPLKRTTQTPTWKSLVVAGGGREKVVVVGPVRVAPDGISEKVVESIKNAEEACAEDPKGGECVAAWDEVEELSAAASHARDKKKESDPLENYCKDNPETDECRTYDN